ncbi:LysR family transcriptional regulator [Marinobacter xestospongiae]|uniref:LysR substrate-binding domain-containing protein n=1 Tax=Marinobacter xestospongiae TaxID=994319 RepID=A0ABU3VY47_9GAMM|nr:LysR substrate-binding domain-containing protein [Marinobacter xestospongiae]MDV2079208.1 LysR substrate-binding domain-containing protein [Marinobacter xestospongiae]
MTHEQVFLRVVDAGSLKAAAEQLNTAPSSVSRRIAALEQGLGVKLLQRSTRRSVPTEAGQRYYQGLRSLVAEKEALEAQIRRQTDTPSGLLRVAAPQEFGATFVVPVITELQNRYPELAVELILGSRFEDLASQDIDVAIRVGQLPDSGLICRRLGDVPRVLVAASTFFNDRALPVSPDDLKALDFIFYGRESARQPIALTGPEGRVDVMVNGRLCVNHLATIRDLVSEGRGVHLGPVWAFREGLSNGSLVALLPDFQLEAFPLHALYKQTPYLPAKIRQFIDRMVLACTPEALGDSRSMERG